MHASVYKCFKIDDIQQKQPLAVKIVREEDEEKILAHKNEFKIMERLNHPNVVRSFEMFINDQKKEVYQVMQYIEGKEVFDLISELGAYREKEAQYIFK
jgi:serine/threonine protein kinase